MEASYAEDLTSSTKVCNLEVVNAVKKRLDSSDVTRRSVTITQLNLGSAEVQNSRGQLDVYTAHVQNSLDQLNLTTSKVQRWGNSGIPHHQRVRSLRCDEGAGSPR